MAHALQTTSVIFKLPTSITKFFALVKVKLAERAKRMQSYRELNALSDRELNDIGLCRGDIHNVVNDNFYKDSIRIAETQPNKNMKGWV